MSFVRSAAAPRTRWRWGLTRLAAASLVLAAAIALSPAKAQVVSCTGPTGGNCVPVVQIPSSLANPAAGTGNAGYPLGSSLIGASTTATTGGITLTMPVSATQFDYLCGFSVSPGSATAAITLTVQTSNTVAGGTWAVGAPVTAAGTTGAILTVYFTPCIRSNTINQSVQLTVGALGTGGTGQAATMWGYQQ